MKARGAKDAVVVKVYQSSLFNKIPDPHSSPPVLLSEWTFHS